MYNNWSEMKTFFVVFFQLFLFCLQVTYFGYIFFYSYKKASVCALAHTITVN